jgi:hypothetical protein
MIATVARATVGPMIAPVARATGGQIILPVAEPRRADDRAGRHGRAHDRGGGFPDLAAAPTDSALHKPGRADPIGVEV